MSSILLTEKQVAEKYPFTLSTLRNQRITGKGIPFVKVGGRIFYEAQDIEAYIHQHKYTSTSHWEKEREKAMFGS